MATMRTRTASILVIFVVVFVDCAVSRGKIRQKRNWIIDSFEMEEEYPGPFPYELGKIHFDVKYLIQFQIFGEGVDKDPKGLLKINEKTGVIFATRKVDYEEYRLLKLRFEARNQSDGALNTRLGIEINIKDINDNVPTFDQIYKVSLDESSKQGRDVVVVRADDFDDSKTRNGTFDLRIVSVTPNDPDIDFVLEQNDNAGKITFKGCLNYEKSQKYTVLVEAKDRGEVVQLSSTGTVIVNVNDNNNHLPVITGQTGSGVIKEGESGVTVLRLQVTDEDTKGTDAWKAKYTLHEDPNKHFNITTDPETNEGILTVVKPLDYEDGHQKKLSVTVENVGPYFSCQVKGRPAQGLWDVAWVDGTTDMARQPITITVEDVNDPPVFFPDVKIITVMENSPVGTALEKFTAKDRDGAYASTFNYKVGTDPAGWVTVDPTTGQVSTKHILDRESPHVNNSLYTVLIWAVDHAEPPMTGTGTLHIHLIDQNDNVPVLDESNLDMCLSDGPTSTNISAHDLDLHPYSDPFHFELLGDVEGKWSLDPAYGTKVKLVKSNAVYAGHHELTIKISDSQGHHSLQNLSITVCSCSDTQSCHLMQKASRMGGAAIGMVFLALLLLLVLLLLACLISCKREKVFILDEGQGWHLLHSNIETPGTDCKIPFGGDGVDAKTMDQAITKQVPTQSNVPESQYWERMSVNGKASQEFGYSQSTARKSFRDFGYGQNSIRMSFRDSRSKGSMLSRNYNYGDTFFQRSEVLSAQLFQRLNMLSLDSELEDYSPHDYACEGEPASDPHLDAISMPDSDFNMDMLKDLDAKFRTLAGICRPDLMELS